MLENEDLSFMDDYEFDEGNKQGGTMINPTILTQSGSLWSMPRAKIYCIALKLPNGENYLFPEDNKGLNGILFKQELTGVFINGLGFYTIANVEDLFVEHLINLNPKLNYNLIYKT